MFVCVGGVCVGGVFKKGMVRQGWCNNLEQRKTLGVFEKEASEVGISRRINNAKNQSFQKTHKRAVRGDSVMSIPVKRKERNDATIQRWFVLFCCGVAQLCSLLLVGTCP